ncbi:GNAT family N-acetyltransferase [Paenibacillus herberti]|uniref:N-acetyltransferase domain-containing protein n=1 Tax=Paenibacillus herberti TaxID=1619309 RepID=A0A229P1H1_9BACL|nr:GNAT family N-acetyltransferase [Paenibacillus herberti]OXM15804.1 hypothetical protein CGZ75_03550 [Paenibacillus herberti]
MTNRELIWRVITDDVTFFYLCDVYVDEEYRGEGIGKKLVEWIVQAPHFQTMSGRWIVRAIRVHNGFRQYDEKSGAGPISNAEWGIGLRRVHAIFMYLTFRSRNRSWYNYLHIRSKWVH